MKRWGLALAGFAIVVVAFLLWRSVRDAPSAPTPAPTEDSSAVVAVLNGTPEPRISRPLRAGAPASITGAVRDRTRRAIAGVRVCALLDDDAEVAPPCATTDATGTYRLAAVPVTVTALTAARPQFRGERIALRPLDPGEARTGVDVVLRAGVRVRGRVVDVRGAAIASARVTETLTVTTGVDGAYELWVEPGRGTLRASADGFATAVRHVIAPADDVEVLLLAASSIAGLVIDDVTGEPVMGARVHVQGDAVITDDEGRFELDGLARGRYIVEANTPNGAARTLEISVGLAEQVEGVVIRLRAAHQLSIRLKRPDGSVCREPVIDLDTWGTEAGSRWRDGDRIRFDGVPPGRYVLTSSCDGVDRTIHPPIDVRGDVLFELTSTHRPFGRLLGRIDVRGRENEEVRIWASGPRRTHSTSMDPDGRYELELEPGRYAIRAGGESPETSEVFVEIVEGRDLEHDVRLPTDTTGRLVITVVDRRGTPMAGMMVMLTGKGQSVSNDSVWTDRAGVVRVRVAAGEYEVTTHLPLEDRMDSAKAAAQVVAGAERTVRLQLDEDGIQLRGIVVDERGAPVPEAVVTISAMDPVNGSSTTLSRADGTFELPGRQYGRGAEVRAFRPGGGASTEVPLLATEPVRLVITIPASVSGTVVMADGSKPARFDVIVKTKEERSTRTFLHTGGGFAIANVPTGVIQLGAAINGIEVWTTMKLDAGEHRKGLAITLPPVASIMGRVIDAGERTPVAGVKLNLMCTRDNEPLAFNHADQRTNADGRFEIRELSPGPCIVEVRPPAGWLPANHTVTVPERGLGDVGTLEIARAR